MKNTIKPTLTLRAHSIRNLTAAELRLANGGVNHTGCHYNTSKGARV